MSFNTTIDDVILQQTSVPENIADKPFVKKEWTNAIYDTNTSSNYASNQVIFDSTTLSNSGSLVSYSEGLIFLPIVIKVSKTAGATTVDWTQTDGSPLKGTDFMLSLKNSHINLVHSYSITLNNTDIIQSVPMVNSYLNFINHSEMSLDDEFLNAPLTGYAKDSSSSWYYNTPTTIAGTTLTGDSRGVGIGNNANFKFSDALNYNETSNFGMLNRQKLVNKYTAEKISVLGDLNTQKIAAKSYIENQADGKYIFYDVVIRLKDLCPNLFKNFPLTLGSKFKITLTLNNNIGFKFQKNNDGNFVYDYSSFSNVSSLTNPIMVAASYNIYQAQTGTNFESNDGTTNIANLSGNYCFKKTDALLNNTLVPCGSSCLPCDTTSTYSVLLKLGSISGVSHQRPQCILYIPSYKMSYKAEEVYFSPESRIKKIHYTDLEYQTFESNTTINKELSSSCVRPKRLIIIPFLAASANFGMSPLSSPFSTEPSTTSPCLITSFNVSVNNVNIFPNDISYSYDHYLQELNGQYGINGNQVSGLTSSRLNMNDFENNYHYLVVDLSRRLPEQDLISSSIKIRGKVSSPLLLEFHCFIETEKIIEIDVMTGALIKRY